MIRSRRGLSIRARPNAQVNDAMWVKILDLPTALSGRTYSSDVDVTLSVSDKTFEQNAGTWHLTAGPNGASCERTNASADMSLDIRTLGSILLGGPSCTSHAQAGWVDEHTSGAVAAASVAFSTPLAPYCPFVF